MRYVRLATEASSPPAPPWPTAPPRCRPSSRPSNSPSSAGRQTDGQMSVAPRHPRELPPRGPFRSLQIAAPTPTIPTAMTIVALDAETLLVAYSQGAFPMTDRDGAIRWYTADPRGILPLETFHVPRT